jgi:acylphosphatase
VQSVPAPDPPGALLEPVDVLLRRVPGLSDPQSESGVAPIRVRLIVTGRVQGVWFRDSCRDQARSESVNGFARNRADGTVEVELEGTQPAVERMTAWCRVGPPRARVDSVSVERIAPVGEAGFRIR